MADNDEDIDANDAEDGGEEVVEAPKRRLSGKVIVLYIALPLILIGATIGGLFAFGILGSSDVAEVDASAVDPASLVFFDLPELLVNLDNGGSQATYLKLKVSLELHDKKFADDLEPLTPRIIDQFQMYLRELRVEDLSGSAGMFRLKEELLRRVNLSVHPVEVEDVLFKELIIQ